MSEQNPIRLFVTHTFAENPDYHRVFEYLESTPNFFYTNCSHPEKMPGTGGKEAVKEELRNQISTAEVVVVLGSLYQDNVDWINYQMDVAQANDLPLIALEPFGGVGSVPDAVAERAAEVIAWNERIIVDALRRQARHEDTQRWDVIEFEMP
jgi:hypothetical protein